MIAREGNESIKDIKLIDAATDMHIGCKSNVTKLV